MSRELGRNLPTRTGIGTSSSQTSEETCSVNDQTTMNSEDYSELNELQFEEHFVEDVRSYRCLWDTTSRSNNDSRKAWDARYIDKRSPGEVASLLTNDIVILGAYSVNKVLYFCAVTLICL